MEPEAAAPAPARTTERWTYAGRRRSAEGKAIDAWATPSPTGAPFLLLYFSAKGRRAIGRTYEVEVSRSGGSTTMHGDPLPLADAEPLHGEEQVRRWRVDAEVAELELLALARERRAVAEQRHLADLTLAQLRDQFQRLPAQQVRVLLSSVVAFMLGGRRP